MLKCIYTYLNTDESFKGNILVLMKDFKEPSETELSASDKAAYTQFKLSFMSVFTAQNESDFLRAFDVLSNFAVRTPVLYLHFYNQITSYIYSTNVICLQTKQMMSAVLLSALVKQDRILIGNKSIHSVYTKILGAINSKLSLRECLAFIDKDIAPREPVSVWETIILFTLNHNLALYGELLSGGYILSSPTEIETISIELFMLNLKIAYLNVCKFGDKMVRAFKKARGEKTYTTIVNGLFEEGQFDKLLPTCFVVNAEIKPSYINEFTFLREPYESKYVDCYQGIIDSKEDNSPHIVYSFAPLLDECNKIARFAFLYDTGYFSVYGEVDLVTYKSKMQFYYFDHTIKKYYKGKKFDKQIVEESLHILHTLFVKVSENIEKINY